MRILRSMLWGVVGLLGAAGVALVAVLVAGLWLVSPAGEAFLAKPRELGPLAGGLRVEVAGFSHDGIAQLSADRLRLADSTGVFLALKDLRLRWQPAQLLGGQLTVTRLAAGQATLRRRPDLGGGAAPPDAAGPGAAPAAQGDGTRLPETLPFAVSLQDLAIERAVLAEGLAGRERVWSLAGNARVTRRLTAATASLAAQPKRAADGRGKLQLTVNPRRPHASLALSWREPGKGPAAAALDLPGQPDIELQLDASGWLDGGEATLAVRAGDSLRLDGSAQIEPAQAAPGYRVAAEARGSLYPVLRPRLGRELERRLAPLLGGRLEASAEARLAPGLRALQVRSARFAAPAGTVTGTGRIDLAADRVAASLSVEAGASAAFQRLVPGLGWRRASAELAIDGPLAQPEAALNLRARAPSWQGWRGDSLRAQLRLRPTAPLPAGPGLKVTGTAVLAEPATPTPRLQAVLGERLQIALENGQLRPGGRLRLSGLSARTGPLELTGEGAYRAAQRQGQLRFTVTAQRLAGLAPALPEPIRSRLRPQGRAELSATLDANGRTVAVDTRLTASQLSLGQPGLDRLVAEGLTLQATGAVDPDGATLAHARLALPGVSASLTAQGDLGLAAPYPVDGKLKLKARDLAVLRRAGLAQLDRSAGGLPALAGRVTTTLAGQGPLAAPQLKLTARGQALRVAGQPLPDSRLEARLKPPWDAPSGRLQASLRHAGEAYALRTRWQADPQARRLALRKLVVRGLGGELTGNLAVRLPANAAPQLRGELRGRTDNLARLGSPLPQLAGFSGAARLQLKLAHGDRGQRGQFSLALNDLTYRTGPDATPVHASQLALKGELARLFGEPTGTVEIAADNIVRETVDLARLDGKLAIGGDSWRLSGEARGTAGRPFQVAGAADLEPAGAGLTVRLDAFTGRFGDERFILAEPATAELRPGDIAIPEIRIEGNKGSIALALKADPEGLEGTLSFDRVPLAILRLTGLDVPVAGRARGRIALSGTLADPQGQVKLRLTDLRATRSALADLPPAQLRLRGELADERVTATGTMFLPKAGAIELTARTALPLDEATLAPELVADQPIEVTSDGELHLAAVNDLLADRGVRLEGRIDVGLGLGGTLANPELTGALGLRKVGVALPTLDVQLSQLTGRIAGRGRRLVLADVTARTPNDGAVDFAGQIQLWGEQLGTGRITASAREAALVSGDTVSVVANTDLTLAVSPAGGELRGTVSVVRANYRIPDRLPGQIVTVDVTELAGAGRGIPLPPPPVPEPAAPAGGDAPAEGAAAAAWPFTLDLTIAAPRRVFIRGRGLDLELRGEVALSGPAAQPALTGKLSLVRGSMDLFGRRFVFNRGTVDFGSGAAADPALDLVATARVRDLDVTLTVGGTASQPSLALSSQPPLPEQEILARILCGGPLDECSAFQAITVANTLNTLGGGGLGVFDELRRNLGVDRLSVSGGGSTGENAKTTPTVEVGRYFGERVFVDVEQTLGERRDTRVNVEIEMTRNIRLQTRVDQNAASRVGINVEWDY